MGCGKTLTEREKEQILAYSDAGMNVSQITKQVTCSRHVISKFLQNPNVYGTMKSPGRPVKLSDRDKRRINNTASNSMISCAKIRHQRHLEVSRMTILRALNTSKIIKRSKMQPCPNLQPIYKQLRIVFAQEHMNWAH